MNFYDNSFDGHGQLTIKYFGGTHALQIEKNTPTAEERFAILSKITKAGARERINLMKISKDEISEIL